MKVLVFFWAVILTNLADAVPFIWVANYGNDSVTVIDGTTNKVVAVITDSSLNEPYPLIVSAQYAYVGNYGNETVSIIDTTTYEVVHIVEMEAGARPSFMEISPATGSVYIANYGSGNVGIINPNDEFSYTTISGFSGPASIAFSNSGQFLYVTDYYSVSVVDTVMGNSVTTPSGFVNSVYYPSQIAISPNGNYAYVTNSTSYEYITVLDLENNTVLPSIGMNYYNGVVFSPNGSTAYGTQGDELSIINTATSTIEGTITMSEGQFNTPYFLAITQNGNALYVPNEGGDTLSVIQIPGYAVSVISQMEGNFSDPYFVAIQEQCGPRAFKRPSNRRPG